MGTNTFAEFVASQQPTPEEAQIDWTAERDEYLRRLDELYRMVGGFLEEYIAHGSIKYSLKDVVLTEENLGTYTAPRMEIRIGKQPVTIEPVGTLLIGSKGRVDVVGAYGRAQLWLVNAKVKRAADIFNVNVMRVGGRPPTPPPPSTEPISLTWKMMTRNPGVRGGFSFLELDKESFFGLVMELANA